jgi:sugar phosphate isomerase/epimerase
MKFMVCCYGNPEEHAYLPLIEKYGFGLELQSYGLKGALSLQEWEKRLELHRDIRSKFSGPLAVHGPFLGIAFNYKDHLLRSAIRERMDMTYEAIEELRPHTLVMHSGYSSEVAIFKFEDEWIHDVSSFWKNEMEKYAAIGVQVVLENIIEETPERLIRLVDTIDHPLLKICMDTGHLNVCAKISPPEWIRRLGTRLRHVHMHDNNGASDQHLPVGRGTLNFDEIFKTLYDVCPDVTVSLEIDAKPNEVIENVAFVLNRYGR